MDGTYMNVCDSVPIKLYLQEKEGGWIWLTGHSLLPLLSIPHALLSSFKNHFEFKFPRLVLLPQPVLRPRL